MNPIQCVGSPSSERRRSEEEMSDDDITSSLARPLGSGAKPDTSGELNVSWKSALQVKLPPREWNDSWRHDLEDELRLCRGDLNKCQTMIPFPDNEEDIKNFLSLVEKSPVNLVEKSHIDLAKQTSEDNELMTRFFRTIIRNIRYSRIRECPDTVCICRRMSWVLDHCCCSLDSKLKAFVLAACQWERGEYDKAKKPAKKVKTDAKDPYAANPLPKLALKELLDPDNTQPKLVWDEENVPAKEVDKVAKEPQPKYTVKELLDPDNVKQELVWDETNKIDAMSFNKDKRQFNDIILAKHKLKLDDKCSSKELPPGWKSFYSYLSHIAKFGLKRGLGPHVYRRMMIVICLSYKWNRNEVLRGFFLSMCKYERISAKSMLHDWMKHKNEEELSCSINKVIGAPNAGKIIVQTYVDYVIEATAPERAAINDIIAILYTKEKLTPSDIQDPIKDFVKFIDSHVHDCPSVYQYIGEMLAILLHIKALNVPWLCETASFCQDASVKFKVIENVVDAVKARYGEGAAEMRALETQLGADFKGIEMKL